MLNLETCYAIAVFEMQRVGVLLVYNSLHYKC